MCLALRFTPVRMGRASGYSYPPERFQEFRWLCFQRFHKKHLTQARMLLVTSNLTSRAPFTSVGFLLWYCVGILNLRSHAIPGKYYLEPLTHVTNRGGFMMAVHHVPCCVMSVRHIVICDPAAVVPWSGLFTCGPPQATGISTSQQTATPRPPRTSAPHL